MLYMCDLRVVAPCSRWEVAEFCKSKRKEEKRPLDRGRSSQAARHETWAGVRAQTQRRRARMPVPRARARMSHWGEARLKSGLSAFLRDGTLSAPECALKTLPAAESGPRCELCHIALGEMNADLCPHGAYMKGVPFSPRSQPSLASRVLSGFR